MIRGNNYLIQANQAKQRFLTYDQRHLIAKFQLKHDDAYFYVNFLCKQYRIHRQTGDMEFLEDGSWQDGNSFEEVMTILDILCDSRDDRWISRRWKNMQSFGLQFHQNLLEEPRNPTADLIDSAPDVFRRACLALNAAPLPGADLSFAFEVLDGLPIAIQFWHGDEEFRPRLRYLWDENAKMYLRYETMYYAVNVLLHRIREQMQHLS